MRNSTNVGSFATTRRTKNLKVGWTKVGWFKTAGLEKLGLETSQLQNLVL